MLATAALVAPYTVVPGIPRCALIDAFRTIAEPLDISGIAFCTVKKTPFILMPTVSSKNASVLFEGDKLANAGVDEQGINAAKTLVDLLHRGLDIRQFAGVRSDREGSVTGAPPSAHSARMHSQRHGSSHNTGSVRLVVGRQSGRWHRRWRAVHFGLRRFQERHVST
jgi:hypothetical protein